MTGDYHPRHHVQGSGGVIFFATFILAMIGLWLVIGRRRWCEPWWRFIIYGLAVSILPGAITTEPFHQVRLMAYPVFLLVLTIQRWNGCWLRTNQSTPHTPETRKCTAPRQVVP
jgi:hypothetical protein